MQQTTRPDADLLVSVIICNFNYGRFIEQAIESVVGQTHERLELIIFDDGSEDDSWDLICETTNRSKSRFERITTLQADQNRGKLHGLNKTIPLALGQATVILDADDVLLPAYIHTAAKLFLEAREKDDRVAIVYSDCTLIDVDGKTLGEGTSEPFDPVLLETQSFLPECALTLTSALKDHLPYDESIRKLTKHHKWLRIVRAGWTATYMQEAGFGYRMHDANMSNIGKRVLAEMRNGSQSERILSDYWDTSRA